MKQLEFHFLQKHFGKFGVSKCQLLIMNKGIITASGYILFTLGFLSILLTLVGLQLTPLKWLSYLGPGLSLIVKLVMLFGGLIIMYISKMPPEKD